MLTSMLATTLSAAPDSSCSVGACSGNTYADRKAAEESLPPRPTGRKLPACTCQSIPSSC